MKVKGKSARRYFFLLFTPPCFTPFLTPPTFSDKTKQQNKLELNTGEPSYCYSTTNLRLADFGKVIRLKRQ